MVLIFIVIFFKLVYILLNIWWGLLDNVLVWGLSQMSAALFWW